MPVPLSVMAPLKGGATGAVRDVDRSAAAGAGDRALEGARAALPPTILRRELHPYEELRCGDRRDRDVVVVGNDGIEVAAHALAGDEDARVENQTFQSLSCGASDSRRARSSDAHALSAPSSRRIAFTSRPSAPEVGPMDATARPRRTTTNVSPWRSTASRSSENRRAASVALMRHTKSDYQTLRRVRRDGLTYASDYVRLAFADLHSYGCIHGQPTTSRLRLGDDPAPLDPAVEDGLDRAQAAVLGPHGGTCLPDRLAFHVRHHAARLGRPAGRRRRGRWRRGRWHRCRSWGRRRHRCRRRRRSWGWSRRR